MAVQAIPAGYHSITPYLVVPDADRLMAFLKEAFGARETHPAMRGPNGRIAHAEVQVGDSRIMMGEAGGNFPPLSAMLYLYVEDVDAVYRRALQAGATSLTEPADQFYGDRNAGIKDPSGNQWWIATHKEDVPPEELMQRAARAAGNSKS